MSVIKIESEASEGKMEGELPNLIIFANPKFFEISFWSFLTFKSFCLPASHVLPHIFSVQYCYTISYFKSPSYMNPNKLFLFFMGKGCPHSLGKSFLLVVPWETWVPGTKHLLHNWTFRWQPVSDLGIFTNSEY